MYRYLKFQLVFLLIINAFAIGNPDARELLETYSKNQSVFQSFILKAEIEIENKSRFSDEELKKIPETSEQKAISDVRYDGKRVKHICEILNDTSKKSSQEIIYSLSNLFDGDNVIQYAKTGKVGDVLNHRLIINKHGRTSEEQKRDPYFGFDSFLLGKYEGDYVRVDHILKNSNETTLSDEKEVVDGMDCFVLEADTDSGEYKIWISPQYGYNIVKVIIRKKSGDRFYNRKVSKGESVLITLNDIKLEQISDAWVPVKGTLTVDNKLANGDFWKTKISHKFYDIKLSPDHDEAGSFAEDEIQNGTLVYIDNEKTMTYTWQDGNLIPNTEAVIAYEVEKITPKNIIMTNPLIGKDSTAIDTRKDGDMERNPLLTLPQISLEDLLNNYSETMGEFKTFKEKAVLIEENVINERSRGKDKSKIICKADGQKCCLKIYSWKDDIDDENQANADYTNLIYDGKMLTKYHLRRGSTQGIKNTDEYNRDFMSNNYPGAFLLGLYPRENNRIDVVLSETRDAKVESKTRAIKGMLCYVVKASNRNKKYELWFDPARGYNILKAEITSGTEERGSSFKISDVKLENTDGVWVVTEAKIEQIRTGKNRSTVTKKDYQRSKIDLDPVFTDADFTLD